MSGSRNFHDVSMRQLLINYELEFLTNASLHGSEYDAHCSLIFDVQFLETILVSGAAANLQTRCTANSQPH